MPKPPKIKLKITKKRIEQTKQYLRENWGAPPIIAFMTLLTAAATQLSLGNQQQAEKLAEYAYYLLVAGVILQTISYIRYARNGENGENK